MEMENNQSSGQFSPATSNADNTEQKINQSQSPSQPVATMYAAVEHVDGTDAASGAEIVKGMQQLMAEMHNLKEDFETKVKYDESKERLIDSLHQELQAYRRQQEEKNLREATQLYQQSLKEGWTFNPSEIGFDITLAQIEDRIAEQDFRARGYSPSLSTRFAKYRTKAA